MDRVLLPRLSTAGFDLDLARLARGLSLSFSVARERRALRGLDARLLRDVGLDAPSAAREAGRALWDTPAGR